MAVPLAAVGTAARRWWRNGGKVQFPAESPPQQPPALGARALNAATASRHGFHRPH